jgi:hypothetical protein
MVRFLALILIAALPTQALAAPRAAAVPAATVATLTRWIEAHSPYSAEGLAPPVIRFCHTGQVIAYGGRNVIVNRKLRAAYDIANDRIFLVSPWSANDPMNLSALLHELVHRLQFHVRKWKCPAAAEPEAYDLQQLWLTEHGIDANFDWLRIYVEARCPSGAHP